MPGRDGMPAPGEEIERVRIWTRGALRSAGGRFELVLHLPCGRQVTTAYDDNEGDWTRLMRGRLRRPPCHHEKCIVELAASLVTHGPLHDDAWGLLQAAGRTTAIVMRYLQHDDPRVRANVGQRLAARLRDPE